MNLNHDDGGDDYGDHWDEDEGGDRQGEDEDADRDEDDDRLDEDVEDVVGEVDVGDLDEDNNRYLALDDVILHRLNAHSL